MTTMLEEHQSPCQQRLQKKLFLDDTKTLKKRGVYAFGEVTMMLETNGRATTTQCPSPWDRLKNRRQ